MHVAMQHGRTHICLATDVGFSMKERLIRLDRIAHAMNAWLLAIAIGLGMLDLTILVAKCMPVLPQLPVASDAGAAHQNPATSPAAQH
jgi:hypothetical protein